MTAAHVAPAPGCCQARRPVAEHLPPEGARTGRRGRGPGRGDGHAAPRGRGPSSPWRSSPRPRAGAHRWRARAGARAHRATQLPHTLDALAASLRSGASLPAALGEAGDALDAPLGPELAGLARAAARGRPVAEVLDEWSLRHGDPATRLAATAMLLATMVGSAPGRAVDGVASTVRERLDLAAERRALGAQARASALVLSAAPVVFTVVLVVGDPVGGALPPRHAGRLGMPGRGPHPRRRGRMVDGPPDRGPHP